MKKYFLIFSFLVGALLSVQPAEAGLLQGNVVSNITNNAGTAFEGTYDPSVTVGSVVGTIIKAFLSLLGIIFVILMIVAGFNWMTAGGDEDKINKAKDTIRSAVIGLIIVIAAYSITYFIFANLPGSDPGGSLQ